MIMTRYDPTEYDGLVPVTDGDWVRWEDAKICLDALQKAHDMLCEQEDALRSLGADEPDAESAILTAWSLLSKKEELK